MQYITNNGKIGLKYGDLSVFHGVNNWFEVGAGGRLLWFGREDGWLSETRSMIYGNVKGSWGNLDLYFSNRFECRVFKEDDDHFRYRQMRSLEIPPLQRSWLKLYISEEEFIMFTDENLYLARIYAGSKIRYNAYLSMKLYYVLENKKSMSRWTGSDVVGLDLSLAF